ncbi:MAG: hypothetical protein HQL37_01590 [Alphaproteobacteria bacterium]|nr:hypothetical protein [Alphaproteobacteria bacterium]
MNAITIAVLAVTFTLGIPLVLLVLATGIGAVIQSIVPNIFHRPHVTPTQGAMLTHGLS